MATVRFSYLQRFRVELRKIGYTKAEANKIMAKIRKYKDNDGYFERACERKFSFGNLISSSFIWYKSPEGHDYWDELYMRLEFWGIN